MSPPTGVPIVAVQVMQEHRYADAIPALEAFCRTAPSGKAYFQAQVWLVKAYKATGAINQAVAGWFRRGVMPWVDTTMMTCPNKWNVSSHHCFWSLLLAMGAISLAFVLPVLIPT